MRVVDVLVCEEAVAVRTGVHVLAGVHVQVASDVVSRGVSFATDLKTNRKKLILQFMSPDLPVFHCRISEIAL